MANSFRKNSENVFRFTSGQIMSKKGFKVSTALIGIIIFAAVLLVLVIGAHKDATKDDEPTGTATFVICNDSDIPELDSEKVGEAVRAALDCKEVTVKWLEKGSVAQECKAAEDKAAADKEDSDSIFAAVRAYEDEEQGKGYAVYIVRPKKCEYSESRALDAGEALKEEIQAYVERNLNPEGVMFLRLQTVGSSIVVGEDTSIAAFLINYMLPLLSGFVMYFMVLMYGQDIARNVSIEKTNKLMETMLTFVSPKALIFGKVLAGFVTAVLQVLIWVVCGIGGYLIGNFIALKINPGYTNLISKGLTVVRNVTGSSSAFTLPAVVLALAIFFFGMLLYFMLAAIGGSMVSKPEEVASSSSVMIFPVIIFWLLGYFAAMAQNAKLLAICRFIPFAAPFTLTAEILTGKVSMLIGLICLAEILVVTFLLAAFAGRVYRGLVFYNGEKLSFRKMIGVIRAK